MIAVLRPIEGSAVHEDRIIGARLRTRVGHTALFVALAVVPVLAFNSLATADSGSDPTAGARPGLTDEQHQCLADQGEQLRAAGQACGLLGMNARPGARGLARGVTDEQRQCLAAETCGRPARGHDGGLGPI
jgi:hypothetical protein